MTLAKIRFLQRKLTEKYGEIGVVASRYVEAGLHVQLMHPTRYGPAHIIATGHGQRIVVEVVKDPGLVPAEVVKNLSEKARLLRARPILVLYGHGPKLNDEVRGLIAELGVKVKQVLPSST